MLVLVATGWERRGRRKYGGWGGHRGVLARGDRRFSSHRPFEARYFSGIDLTKLPRGKGKCGAEAVRRRDEQRQSIVGPGLGISHTKTNMKYDPDNLPC